MGQEVGLKLHLSIWRWVSLISATIGNKNFGQTLEMLHFFYENWLYLKTTTENLNLTFQMQFLFSTLDSERDLTVPGFQQMAPNSWLTPCTYGFTRFQYMSLLLAFGNRRFIPFCVVYNVLCFFLKRF